MTKFTLKLDSNWFKKGDTLDAEVYSLDFGTMEESTGSVKLRVHSEPKPFRVWWKNILYKISFGLFFKTPDGWYYQVAHKTTVEQ